MLPNQTQTQIEHNLSNAPGTKVTTSHIEKMKTKIMMDYNSYSDVYDSNDSFDRKFIFVPVEQIKGISRVHNESIYDCFMIIADDATLSLKDFNLESKKMIINYTEFIKNSNNQYDFYNREIMKHPEFVYFREDDVYFQITDGNHRVISAQMLNAETIRGKISVHTKNKIAATNRNKVKDKINSIKQYEFNNINLKIDLGFLEDAGDVVEEFHAIRVEVCAEFDEYTTPGIDVYKPEKFYIRTLADYYRDSDYIEMTLTDLNNIFRKLKIADKKLSTHKFKTLKDTFNLLPHNSRYYQIIKDIFLKYQSSKMSKLNINSTDNDIYNYLKILLYREML